MYRRKPSSNKLVSNLIFCTCKLYIHFTRTCGFYFNRNVLELVLQGCKGDVVKAIEHFLSAQEPSSNLPPRTLADSKHTVKTSHIGECNG